MLSRGHPVAPASVGVRSAIWHACTSLPALLFGFFVALYALTSAGRLDSADGGVVALTAQSLLQHGTIALPASAPDVVIGVGGFGYSKYGIAQSLVEIPFVIAGLALRHFTHNQAMIDWAISFANVPITAIGCSLLFLLVRRLGVNPRRAVALTLIYGLCTLAWPYAKTDFNEPLQTTSMLAAAYAALRARQTGRTGWLWAAGGWLAVTLLTKAAMLVVVPAYALYVLSDGVLESDWRARLELWRKWSWWRGALRREAALLAPVALALGFTLWLNTARFGSPLDFGYSRAAGDAPFTIPIYQGTFGLLFSFNTGLIFYATPVLLSIGGIRRFARQHSHETLLIVALAVLMLVLYGGYRYWAGLAAYGPRYLVPLVPFLLLPAADAFPGLEERPSARPWALALVVAASLLGFAEQALGILVSFGAYSSLTCLQTPCPASLDASQSELLYDIWLLRPSLAYNFLGHLPHVVLGSYPFGSAPPGKPNWPADLLDRMRYFWFVALPHPRIFLAAGLTVCGGLMASALSAIVHTLWTGEPAEPDVGAQRQPAGVAAGASIARTPDTSG